MPETRIPMEAIHAAEAAVRDGVRIRLGENALALAAQGQPLMLSGTEAELAVCLAMAALTKHGLIAGTPAPAGEGAGVTAPPRPPASTHSPETSGAGGNGQPEPSEALSALRGEPLDLDAARQRINRAHTELGEVCAQGPSRRFKMHIPADPERDTDLIISAALNDADLLTGEVDQLRETLARALRIADYHAGLHRQAADILARLFPSIECVLIDHADELDDEQGRVDANLSELAHVYCELTGFDARAAASEEQTGGGNG